MAREGEKVKSPVSFWEIVFRHKVKIVLAPMVIITGAVLIILFAPRTYRSEAKVFLQVGRESVGVDPTAIAGPTISLQQSGRQGEVKSATQVIQSRGLISKVVEQLGSDYVLRGGPGGSAKKNAITEALSVPLKTVVALIKSIDPVSEHEEAIIEIEKHLNTSAERDSTVIVLSYDTESPVGAQHILQTIVKAYQEEHLRIHRNQGSRAFLAEQRDRLQRELDAANKEVRDAKNRMGLASVDGRRETLEGQLQSIDLESYRAEQSLSTALARVADLRRQTASMPERQLATLRQIPNEGADLLRDQLYALQMREMALKARYNDTHPLVVAVATQVQEAEKVVEEQQATREEATNDVNPIFRQLSLELKQQTNQVAGLQARLDTLNEQKRLVMHDLKRLNNFQLELEQLQRMAHIAEKKFFSYAENLEQARIDEALEEQRISSVSIAQYATLAEKPISPSKAIVSLSALLLSAATVVAWVVGSEQLNDRLRSDRDVEQALELPVLSTVPESAEHRRVLST